MRLSKLWPLFITTNIITIISQYSGLNPLEKDLKNEDEEIHYREIQSSDVLACKGNWTESMPPNYIGPNLTSSNREILTLCPGDSFGDLNNTYLVMKNCNLEMYHKDILVWSTRMNHLFNDDSIDCALSLKQDGNLILNEWVIFFPGTRPEHLSMDQVWSSETNFKPLKTELRVQDQQFQIVQTFKDETQRLFYLSETCPEFREYLGEPKKVGGLNFIKSHDGYNTTILRKNEYLGDRDKLHLILQENCELHLINHNRTIWYFFRSYSYRLDCSLIIQEGKWISLSRVNQLYERSEIESLIMLHHAEVLDSQFILKNDQLTVIQTLEDGSEFVFESQPGQDIGLKLQKKQLRQLAKGPIKLTSSQLPFKILRMDYIGDLNGLHLILQDDCTFMLFNGQKRLWQFNEGGSYMECKVELFSRGPSTFKSFARDCYGCSLGDSDFSNGEIVLKDNHAIITGYERNSKIIKEFYAGPNTYGDWFWRISKHSLVLSPQKRSSLYYGEKAFIGDLNGVYLMTFQGDCHWILFNQSQVLWKTKKNLMPRLHESMPEFDDPVEYDWSYLYFKNDGVLTTPQTQGLGSHPMDGYTLYDDGNGWSTEDGTQNIDTYKELLTFEFSIQNDWLWLTHTYVNGTVKKFKALEGTNSFILV